MMHRKVDRATVANPRSVAITVPRNNSVTRPTLSSLQKGLSIAAASRELKDVLEKKIEDLSRQLAEERQHARQNKMSVSRLQRELARSKSHERHQGKEQLSKELEHEKMLRVEAERRLRDMTRESESCHSRLASLQEEFQKMEGMVQDMIQYKSKIDQLKQERSSLSSTYESNIEKFKGHITDLERENIMLLNEVKKLESQYNKTDGRDRYKLLLERLRMVEGENSSLVLENEQQRGQYEKCLDEIANQVVQALLAQKMLREECLKLQDKVQDLENQNQHLRVIYQQRLKLLAEGNLQEGGVYMEGSMESLQSTFSEQTSDNTSGIPQMSSPPIWLQNRLPGDRQSIMSFTGSTMSTPDIDLELAREQNEFQCRTKIETEFPATPSSPKSKHVSIMERKNETKRSSSTSSLLPPKCGPNRQRTRSTSSLSRARGLSLISPRTVSQSSDSGTLNNLTNEQSSLNQGVAVSANQQGSTKSLTNQNFTTSLSVPLNQSHPSIDNCTSQGQLSQSASKIPGLPGGKSKEDLAMRRNSLKAEYSIRMGCHSPVSNTNISMTSNSKPAQPKKSSTHGSRSSSVSSIGQGQSRLPSTTSARSQSTGSGSKIPMVSKGGSQTSLSGSTSKLSRNSSSIQKGKNNGEKVITTKLVPPKSPNLRYSGIRTTLKTDVSNKTVHKMENAGANSKTNVSVSNSNVSLKTVYSITSVSSTKVTESKINDKKKPPAIPVRGNINHRNESHFPKMGLTTLNHSGPKNTESTTNVYANVNPVPMKSSSSSPQSEKDVGVEQSENNTLTKGQYFYDYSDEDSDFRDSEINRPVSTDFSAASTISLDELLDRTLENIGTPVDSDFSSNIFLFKTSQNRLKEGTSSDESKFGSRRGSNNDSREGSHSSQSSSSKEFGKAMDTKTRLMGKPDIVQDTEESEQRKLQQSMTLSQIPGSSMPGYRAKRPKSLILGAKEKKFLYCEYGSSSSSDTSDEEWSCKFSYAKNVKEQEIKSKVAKSVQSGEAKVIESPKSANNHQKESPTNQPKGDKSNTVKMSQLPKPGANKKPSKIPPPVAAKPSKLSVNLKSDARIPRPKSVEICVNSASFSYVNTKNCNSYLPDSISNDFSKAESEHCLNFHKSYDKIENSFNSNSTFEEVKVERSGSKDDGYSTMSSDIQPENLEKYSDAFESSTNSNEARNSNLSLSSQNSYSSEAQNSYSSEDRVSGHGSLGRVKAMKVKFELDNQKSPELSPTKTPPISPAKSGLKSPKPVIERLNNKFTKETNVLENSVSNNSSMSKLPKPKVIKSTTKDVQSKPKSSIPTPRSINVKKESTVTKADLKQTVNKVPVPQKVSNVQKLEKSKEMIKNVPQTVTMSSTVTNTTCSVKDSPSVNVQKEFDSPKVVMNVDYLQMNNPLTSTPKTLTDQFEQLSQFSPAYDNIDILREGYDSNSSISDRGSDLTSLHISEDNILSDIPEEKDGYESSVGFRSENTSISSLPAVNVKRSAVQQTTNHNSSSHHSTVKHHFSTSLKRHWSSCEGIVRASYNSDYEKQKRARQTADYDELYGGCLNIETLLERSSSESDMFTRGDKPEVILLPRLQRSLSAENILLDDIMVEDKLAEILKQNVMQQISRHAESADKDGEHFTSFVELLIQRGHVLESPSPLKEVKDIAEIQTPTPTELKQMAVSTFSSKGQNPCPNNFVSEERSEAELPPLGEDQKRFNSQFYSLCNTGSSRSISDKSENTANESTETSGKNTKKAKNVHTCKNGDKNCKKCEELRNVKEFDNISRQIESLSKTVNQLHRSLTSINSENSDSGSESNEGDVRLSSAIGNKDIDGYQWVEDEFFLSPYGGEIILGSSPFSKTGASCDWINDYNENTEQLEEIGGQEVMLEDNPEVDIQMEFNRKNKRNSMQNSIIADSLDKEGNFDSHHFISRRLLQEEQRRKTQPVAGGNEDTSISMPQLLKLESTMNEVINSRSKPLLKEDMRMTPEKDTDDTEKQKHTGMFEKMLMYHGGSQDSLDDNIGVDNVMCHRLLGKGPVVNKVPSTTRPALEFSSNQFIRYEAPEIQAMAAFDFLNEISSSHHSDQSNDQKMSHDQLFRQEGRTHNPMTQSTTSNESSSSIVKRHRRKLRQRIKKDPKARNWNLQGQPRVRKFSSTSADESNDEDEDLSLSDSLVESCSSSEDVKVSNKDVTKTNSKMTYL